MTNTLGSGEFVLRLERSKRRSRAVPVSQVVQHPAVPWRRLVPRVFAVWIVCPNLAFLFVSAVTCGGISNSTWASIVFPKLP